MPAQEDSPADVPEFVADTIEVPAPAITAPPAYVVVDTETTGLHDFSKPADAPGQPRLASLALIHLAADLSIEREQSFLIRPDGWEMNPEAAAIHGLTQERLLADGVPVADALGAYNAVLDSGAVLVGYNVSYDLKVMRGELRRAGLPDRFGEVKKIECIHKLISVCKVPKAKGNGFKTPKLAEAYAALTGMPLIGAHEALADARATTKIFQICIERGILSRHPAAPKSLEMA